MVNYSIIFKNTEIWSFISAITPTLCKIAFKKTLHINQSKVRGFKNKINDVQLRLIHYVNLVYQIAANLSFPHVIKTQLSPKTFVISRKKNMPD